MTRIIIDRQHWKVFLSIFSQYHSLFINYLMRIMMVMRRSSPLWGGYYFLPAFYNIMQVFIMTYLFYYDLPNF